MYRGVLLLAYSVPRVPKQEKTFEWIEKNRAWLEEQGIRLDMVEVGKDRRYQDAIVSRWNECANAGMFLTLLEHDEVPNRNMFHHFDTCPHLLCAQDYLLSGCRVVVNHREKTYHCQDHRLHVSFRHRAGPEASYTDWRWGKPGDEFADYGGFGFTRFLPELMRLHPPQWNYTDCSMIDSDFSVYMIQKKVKFHMHYPRIRHLGAKIESHQELLPAWNHDRTVLYTTLRYEPRLNGRS